MEARRDFDKRHYEKANETLEGLRYVTAGTRLGGEVLFLLGETAYKRGKYPEAESHYAAYLNTYQEGSFAEKAVYMQAMSKIRQIQKRKIGFFSFRSYIPHDRDITLLREARVLFEIYMGSYPSGEWFEAAAARAEELLLKEGRHELEIASFYLKKKNPRSALARAERVLDGDYPDSTKAAARDLAREAEKMLSSDGARQDL